MHQIPKEYRLSYWEYFVEVHRYACFLDTPKNKKGQNSSTLTNEKNVLDKGYILGNPHLSYPWNWSTNLTLPLWFCQISKQFTGAYTAKNT